MDSDLHQAAMRTATIGQPRLDTFEITHLKADLKGHSIRGGLFTLSSQGAKFALQLLSTMVLARVLTPADFGLVAMVTAVTGVVHLFSDAGLSHATVQRQEISHAQVSTVFWINVSIGIGLMLITVALSPAVGWLYSEPRLVPITQAVAFTFILVGLTVQHDALLKRQMRYRDLAIRDVISSTGGAFVAILVAWWGAGYWALVVLPATTYLCQLLCSWFMLSWRPGLPRRDAAVRSMLLFGGRLTAFNFIAYLHRTVDHVLIGWFWGAGPLGLYSRAYGLLKLPLNQIEAPITAVAMPAFSRLQNEPERYARYYLRTINLIMWLAAPLIGFLFAAAEPIILVVLGEQWRESAVVFQLLAISALPQPLYHSLSWLFISRGRADRFLKLALLVTPPMMASFLLGLPFGIKGVALCYSVVVIVNVPWVFHFSFKGTPLTLMSCGKAILWPVSLCLAAVVCAWLSSLAIAPEAIVARLLTVIGAFAVVYSGATVLPSVRGEIAALSALWHDIRPVSRV